MVAFGTSAPVFAVSIKSLLAGSGDIVLGNVIGSNILNILLILGLSAFFHPLNVKNNTVKKELPITLMMTCAFAPGLMSLRISTKPGMSWPFDTIMGVAFCDSSNTVPSMCVPLYFTITSSSCLKFTPLPFLVIFIIAFKTPRPPKS